MPDPLSHMDIIQKIPQAFESARQSGDLMFFPSTIVTHNELGVDWEITLCPALQHKPALPTPHLDSVESTAAATPAGKKLDPFAPPYNPQLHVGDLRDEEGGDEYAILLNKYAVVPHHFLLVTKEFVSQGSPLLPSELVQVYQLLGAAQQAGRHFFAFYNCGDNSGASQPHKHVQFIPTKPTGPPIEALAKGARLEIEGKPFSLSSLPYASHTYRLPTHFTSLAPVELEPLLAGIFLQLLDLTIQTVRHDPTYPTGRPSFNVLMTLNHIHLIPRKSETATLSKTREPLSINSLGFAGMLLVKSEVELEAVKEETIGNILREVGVNSVHEMQAAEPGESSHL